MPTSPSALCSVGTPGTLHSSPLAVSYEALLRWEQQSLTRARSMGHTRRLHPTHLIAHSPNPIRMLTAHQGQPTREQPEQKFDSAAVRQPAQSSGSRGAIATSLAPGARNVRHLRLLCHPGKPLQVTFAGGTRPCVSSPHLSSVRDHPLT
jgi:hypothetical protein